MDKLRIVRSTLESFRTGDCEVVRGPYKRGVAGPNEMQQHGGRFKN